MNEAWALVVAMGWAADREAGAGNLVGRCGEAGLRLVPTAKRSVVHILLHPEQTLYCDGSTHEYLELSMSTQGRLDHEYEYSGALWIMSMNTPKFQDQVDPT